MLTQKMLLKQYYIELVAHASSTLKCSLAQIQEKYSQYPLYVIDCGEKEVCEECMEIRLSKYEVTLTCFFNRNQECIITFLFPDKSLLISELTFFIVGKYAYSLAKQRFTLDNCFLRVEGNMCLVFYL